MKIGSTKNGVIDTVMSSHQGGILGGLIIGVLLCAHTAQAFTALTNEFWVSAMPNTNPTPAGTIADPYDGSTQSNFDSVMGSMPSNCTVHLLAGTYLTKGNFEGFVLKAGQKVRGSGVDITTLQLTGPVRTCFALGSVMGTGIEVSDLTCDANAQNNLPNTIFSGVAVGGPYSKVQRVKVVNLAASTPGETWGIEATGDVGVSCDGVVIEDCVVMPPLFGSVCSSIAIFAATNSYISARIAGNTVYGTNTTSVQAFNVCNALNTLLTSNRVIGATAGVYSDSGGNANLTVVSNTFNNVANGVVLGGQGQVHSNLVFSGNLFSLQYLTNQWVFGVALGGGAVFKNVTIVRNTIQPYANPGPTMRAVYAQSVCGLTVVSNIVDSSCDWSWPGSLGVNVHDNVDLLGNSLPTTKCPLPPSAPRILSYQ